jgi:flagellar motor protein MotB
MAEHETEHHEGAAADGEHGGGHGGGSHGGGHAGGGHEEGHEGAPEWLISFADNVMLQMGFFVILLALNIGEKAHGPTSEGEGTGQPSAAMMDFAIAVREAFNNPVDLNSSAPQDQALIRRIKQKELEGDTKEDGPPGDKQNMSSIRPSDYINLCGTVGFERGESAIPFEGSETIFEIAKRVGGHRFIVEVRGYVSSAEAAEGEDKDKTSDRGMYLSYARAMAVAKQLESDGVTWRQLRVVAGGDTQRNTGRAQGAGQHRTNQRVEIVQTEELMPEDPYSQESRGDSK